MKPEAYKKLWRNYGDKFMSHNFAKRFLARILWLYLQLVYKTNILVPGSENPKNIHLKYNPFIITFWHGRHLMGPFLRPKDEIIEAMFSRSKDAELNAIIGEMLGLKIVRGSGGRVDTRSSSKGGARALLRLKKDLTKNICVAMIANISHTSPRRVGRGLINLAKISQRPIIAYIYAFSREKILENSWDKMALPLPFGRCVFLCSEPFYVNRDISDEEVERKALELTKIMDDLTEKAYAMLRRKK